MPMRLRRCRPALFLGLALIPSATARATFFQQTNLVSNVQGLAPNFDASLQNPWGVSFTGNSPFWVSNQVTGNASLFNGTGVPQALAPTISGGNPTGQVANADNSATDFLLPNGARANFIFSTLNGTIVAWNGAIGNGTAPVVATPAGTNSYTGLTQAVNGASTLLYAANDAPGPGRIDVFNSNWQLVNLPGTFTDPNLPSGFTPYGIRAIGSTVYVTYENQTSGGGALASFDLNGNFLRQFQANAAGGILNGPWGLAIAPPGFGQFGNDLLVGAEGDGHISAFDPNTGAFLGQLMTSNGQALTNGFGLWALNFGNNGAAGNAQTLYIATGINGETGGLLAAIDPVPEPAAITLFALGAVGLCCGSRFLRGPGTPRSERA